jgi:hypothetical protein
MAALIGSAARAGIDIAGSAAALAILRYDVLFGSHTQHMRVFSVFVGSFYPGIVDEDLPVMKMLVEAGGWFTRGELLAHTWSIWQRDPTLQQEWQDDVNDVANANASRRTP